MGLKPGGAGRIWAVRRADAPLGRGSGGVMATGVNLSNLASAMDNAEFVLIDGVVFATEYTRIPDERTVADDVVLEATHGDTEITFTLPGNGRRPAPGRWRLSAEIGRGDHVPVERNDPLSPVRRPWRAGRAGQDEAPGAGRKRFSAGRNRRFLASASGSFREAGAERHRQAARAFPWASLASTGSPPRHRPQCRSAW